uniref:Expressed protein n=2 Tax=Schizophyllum commune (strain H4-8 / FGSC 9210) TaxID=578458 RepID=D8PM18_SCHCM
MGDVGGNMGDVGSNVPLVSRSMRVSSGRPSLKIFVDIARIAQPFNSKHRFEAIHIRRALAERDAGVASDPQVAYARGYADGFMTVKTFALEGGSRLGFRGQYVMDSVKSLNAGGAQLGMDVAPPDGAAGSIVAPGMEERYRDGFFAGLNDGEDAIRAVMAML